MKRKKLYFYVTSLLLMVLVGCTNSGQLSMNEDPNSTISSDSTTISSDEYPHTTAIPIQHAKYIYEPTSEQINHQNMPFQPPQFISDQPQQEKEISTPTEIQPSAGISETEARVIELTNTERTRHGLPELQTDPSLSNVAQEKSNDMQANNYFSHTSPTYGSPFDMIRDFGVSFQAAGENIAYGQQTPEQVVQAWMDSEGHRQNILSGNYTHIGVGYNQNGHYWAQMFISK